MIRVVHEKIGKPDQIILTELLVVFSGFACCDLWREEPQQTEKQHPPGGERDDDRPRTAEGQNQGKTAGKEGDFGAKKFLTQKIKRIKDKVGERI